MLEESFRKQKMEDSSLPKAIIRAVWKSLAVNAVFAGVNTTASYMGPFLITDFVNYLLEKHDDSCIYILHCKDKLVILLCQVLFQGLQMGSNYWMAWGTEKEGRVSRERLIWVFILLSGGSSIFILGRAVFLATIAIQTAQSLFLRMITSVFRAPISFSTPLLLAES
ncbi:hypothetical protein ABKV19_015925 [Rosa sericea]